jgi:hypothetical protein
MDINLLITNYKESLEVIEYLQEIGGKNIDKFQGINDCTVVYYLNKNGIMCVSGLTQFNRTYPIAKITVWKEFKKKILDF